MIFAHGLGGRQDLPLPLWLFNYQAVIAIVGSVILLSMFWQSSKLDTGKYYKEIKSRSILGGLKILEIILRVASLAVFSVTLFASLFGDLGSTATIAPVTIFVIFWVGLVLLSGVFGNSWKVFSPWDTIALTAKWIKDKLGLANAKGQPDILPPSIQISAWIQVVGLFGFVWLELIHPDPSNTRLLGFLVLLYTIFMLLGASLWGRSWLKQADAFALLHKLIGSLGVFATRRIRVPFTGTAELKFALPQVVFAIVFLEKRKLVMLNPPLPQVVFIIVFLGSTTFDGITNTDFWIVPNGWKTVPINTWGIIATIILVGAAYFLAMYLAGRLTKSDPFKLAHTFAHTLIPIALAYSVAHYFSFLVFEGQRFLQLLSDPLNQGWNLFGTADRTIDYLAVSTKTIAWVQALSIIVGHLVGVFLAHDRAHSIWPNQPKLANRSQYPLVIVMICYTLLGLSLLLAA